MFPSPPVLCAGRYRQVREAGDWPVDADERSWRRMLPVKVFT